MHPARVSIKESCPLGKLELSVTHVELSEQLSRPFQATLTLSGSKLPNDVDMASLIGSDASFSIGDNHWHGIVCHFGYLSPDPSAASNTETYQAVVVPKLWRLGLSAHNRVFLDLSSQDIIKSICAEHGLSAPKNSQLLGTDPRGYCTQHEESDLAFIERLTIDAGLCYRFEHSTSQSQFALVKAPDSSAIELNDRLVANLSFVAAMHTGEIALSDFDMKSNAAVTTTVRSPGAFAEKSAALQVFGYNRLTSDTTGVHAVVGGQPKQTATNMARFYESAGSDAFCHFELSGGTDALTKLALGIGAQIKGISAVDQLLKGKMKVVVTRIELSASESYDGGANQVARIFCGLAVEQYCLPTPPKPRPRGPVSAVVTKLRADESTSSDPVRSVEVKFPWHDQQTSCWLRVVQPYAGKGWGASFVPRINQEVLVDFINGDIDRPVVIGALYNGENNGPEYTSTQSGLKTERENELRFDDKSGEEEVYLAARKNMKANVQGDTAWEMTGNQSENIGKDYTRTVKGAAKDTIEGQCSTEVKAARQDKTTQSHSIESDQAIELKVSGCSIKIDTSSITIEAMGNKMKLDANGVTIEGVTLKMSAQTTAELKANASVSVQGSGMAELKSSGMTTVKGSMTMIN